MLTMIDQLIRHKWWANTNLLRAIEEHKPASEDEELRKLLHHILVSNRYWLLLALSQPFIDEEEKRVPGSHKDVIESFAATEELEMRWLSTVTASDLERPLQPRALPGTTITVAQAVIQMSLHSQGHRSQCASRLRELGGTPAPTDFVLWVRRQNAGA